MFTVILVSDRALLRFERWRVLFEPFEQAGLLKVCEWNRRAPNETLSELVPELADAIRGKSEWRAIVVDTLVDVEDDWEKTVSDNPFDYLDNVVARPDTGRTPEQLNLEASAHPLIHLAHLLLGYPDITPKAFLADPSYWDRDLNRRIYQSDVADESGDTEDAALKAEQFRAELGGKRDVQVHYRELPYTDDEIRLHRELTERYRLLHVRPNEVIFLATREPKNGNPIEDLRRAWGTTAEYNPSRFVERNDYPPSCRFLVHDLPRANDNRFETEKLRLWLGLLCIAVNELPGSAIQAERVYGLELKLDEKELASLLNSQLTQLTAEREFTDEVIEKPRRATDSSVQDILRQQPVRVAFDDIGGSELQVKLEGYSLASDMPRRESVRWQESMNGLRTAAESFGRKPRRALHKSVLQVRSYARAFRKDDITLDDISLDELQEELAKQSQRLAHPTSQDVLNRALLEERIEKHDATVRRAIARRMEKRTIIAASAVVVMAWTFAFAPYLALAAWNIVAFIESLSVVMVTLGILGTLGVGTLLFMRSRLLKTIREVNSDMRHYVASVNAGATEFTSYLTSLLTFMRGQAVLLSTQDGTEQALSDKRAMEQTRARIVKQIDRGKALIRALGEDLNIEKGASSFLRNYGASEEQVARLFHWPTSRKEVPLNGTGEKLNAPYDVIKRLSIVKLDLQEPDEESTQVGRVTSA